MIKQASLIANQFRRILYDDGRDDKSFWREDRRLKEALAALKASTDSVVRASLALQAVLASKAPIEEHKLGKPN